MRTVKQMNRHHPDRASRGGRTHIVPWLKSVVVRRYLAVSLLSVILVTVGTILLYDHSTDQAISESTDRAVDDIGREIVDNYLMETQGALNSHLSLYFALIDDLLLDNELQKELPELFDNTEKVSPNAEGEIRRYLKRPEHADDILGLLLFDNEENVIHKFSASRTRGPFYTSIPGVKQKLPPDATKYMPCADRKYTWVSDPFRVSPGEADSFLLRCEYKSKTIGSEIVGSLALHIRIKSLTDHLLRNNPDNPMRLEHVLITPSDGFSHVGTRIPKPTTESSEQAGLHGQTVRTMDLKLPGWKVATIIHSPFSEILTERIQPSVLELGTRGLLAFNMALVIGVILLFHKMTRKVALRLNTVVDGASAIASGNLDFRIDEQGEDEFSYLASKLNDMAQDLDSAVIEKRKAEERAVLATELAHEIKNPLSAIKANIPNKAYTSSGEDLRLEPIRDGVERMSELLDEYMDFARPRDPEPANTRVREIVGKIHSLFRSAALSDGVIAPLDGDLDLMVKADSKQVMQILNNLLINALHAVREDQEEQGEVSLKVEQVGTYAKFEVIDNGCGIEKEVLHRIKEPFFTTRVRGHGLGLAISDELARQNGGDLDFESKPGKGTKATLRIPIANGNRP